MRVQAYAPAVQQRPKIQDDVEVPSLLSGEDLLDLGDVGRAELIQGELIFMTPTGYPHGIIESDVTAILRNFVYQYQLGYVLSGEVGIYTKRDPDTVRGADVVYISKERLTQAQSQGYLDVAPELIVEVLSPNDRWSGVIEKLEEYFAIGVEAVWIADPERQEIFVYHSLTDVQRFTTDDNLPGGTILPGFEVPISEFFGVTFEDKSGS